MPAALPRLITPVVIAPPEIEVTFAFTSLPVILLFAVFCAAAALLTAVFAVFCAAAALLIAVFAVASFVKPLSLFKALILLPLTIIPPAVIIPETSSLAAATVPVVIAPPEIEVTFPFTCAPEIGVIAELGLFILPKAPLKLLAPLKFPITIFATSILFADTVPVVIAPPEIEVTFAFTCAPVIFVFATVSSVGVIAELGLFKFVKAPLKLLARLNFQ